MHRESRRLPAAARIILLAVMELAFGFASAHAMPPLWIEAEDYVAQEGSRAPRFRMPTASGGACVDNGWDGEGKHFLRYDVELAEDAERLFVTLRYARETPGDAAVAVLVDGREEHTRVVRLPSTGDWGFRPDGWKYAQVELPATAKGKHVFEIRSTAGRNNVNCDGFYWSDAPLDTSRPTAVPPAGPDLIAALDPTLGRLPCKTPLALPFSKRKAYVDGAGRVQSLVYRENVPLGAAWSAAHGSRLGPALQVMLDGHGPWRSVEQSFAIEPVPAVVTRFAWPDLRVEQTAFASATEPSGFWVRVRVENRSGEPRRVELVSLLQNAAGAAPDGDRWTAGGQPLLRAEAADGVETVIERKGLVGPLGGPPRLRHRVLVPAQADRSFDVQFLGAAAGREGCMAETQKAWRQRLPASPLRLPDPALQHAYDTCLRQLLSLIEPWGKHARVLKGLEHYYGANPYDTFQASRALDAAGLHAEARELLCHQLEHLKADGIFEMWETGDLARAGGDQWIVQGLTASALWNHYQATGDEAWLRRIAPALVRSAEATLRIRRGHSGTHRQGQVEVSGWLPPIGGDGGLGHGYHWSQNTGPLAGVRIAAKAARRLRLPEADALEAGCAEFQQAIDRVRIRSVEAAGLGMVPAFPGAAGDDRTRPLWGVVLSATALGGIPPDDPAAVATLRFLQRHQQDGLHLNLGYSPGVWPYLSAEVAQWHLRLGEREEARRILRAIVQRASSTVCWYEEVEPNQGHGDSADVWAAAEVVYLSAELLKPASGTRRASGDAQPPAAARPRMLYGDATRHGRPFAKDPCVIRLGGRYLMYYSMAPSTNPAAPKGWAIGIAESRDLSTWNKAGEILPEQDCEKNGLVNGKALLVRGKVHLFYNSYGNGRSDALCHAVSNDGLTFARDPTNPILRAVGDWNAGRAIDCDAFEHDGKLWLIYATRDPTMKTQMLAVATAALDSDFGRAAWTHVGNGPILEPELPWETKCIEAPSVIKRGDRLYLFYGGGYNNDPQQVGCAVSRDGLHWTRLFRQPLWPNGEPDDWNASETGHPGVFEDTDGRTYLFVQGNREKGKTWFLSCAELDWQDGRPAIHWDSAKFPTKRPGPAAHHEDGIDFSIGWTCWRGTGPRGGGLHYANAAGCRADIVFEGTTLTLIHKAGPDCGVAEVLIDGQPAKVPEIDTYAPQFDWNQRTTLAAGLPPGRHIVTVRVAARKNPASSNCYVQIVGFATG